LCLVGPRSAIRWRCSKVEAFSSSLVYAVEQPYELGQNLLSGMAADGHDDLLRDPGPELRELA
jgi:hypothetical protein